MQIALNITVKIEETKKNSHREKYISGTIYMIEDTQIDNKKIGDS